MLPPDYDQILSSLPSLSRHQLEEIRRRSVFLLQHKSSSVPVEDEDWLLLGILTELQQRGLDNRSSFKIKRTSSYAGFSTQSERIRSLIATAVPNMSSVQQRAMGEVAADALCRYLLSWRDPPQLSRSTLLRYVGRVPEALDWSYPGYIASGLLGLTIIG